MNIHEYLKERGFEMTGEFGHAQPGEHYLAVTGETPRHTGNCETTYNYLILKKLRQTFEFDGQTFEVPEGYVFERVGLVGPSDVGKYFLDGPEVPYPLREITRKSLEWRDCIYLIFRKDAQ